MSDPSTAAALFAALPGALAVAHLVAQRRAARRTAAWRALAAAGAAGVAGVVVVAARVPAGDDAALARFEAVDDPEWPAVPPLRFDLATPLVLEGLDGRGVAVPAGAEVRLAHDLALSVVRVRGEGPPALPGRPRRWLASVPPGTALWVVAHAAAHDAGQGPGARARGS